MDSVDELETDLDQSKESMYKLSYVIRVSAPDLDELKRRCDEVKDFYDDLNVKLVRPAGDMMGLHGEFLPASRRYINDYIQYVKSDFLADLVSVLPKCWEKIQESISDIPWIQEEMSTCNRPLPVRGKRYGHKCVGFCFCRFAWRWKVIL